MILIKDGGVVTRRVWTKGVYYILVSGDDAEDIENLNYSIILTPANNSSVDARFETQYITHNSENIVYWNTANIDVQANPISYSPNFTITQQADVDLASYNTPFFLNGYSGEYKTYDLCTLYIGYCPSSSYNQDNPVWQTKAFLLNSESPYLVGVNALDYTYSFNIPSRDLLPGVVVNNSDYIRVWVVKPVANTNGDVLFDKVWHISGRTQQQIELDEQNQTSEQLTELTQGVNDLNQNITSVNDTLNNSTVDESNVDAISGLGVTVNDTTGLDGAFTILYNAFCTDEIQSLSLQVPFTNNTFTISSNTFPFPEIYRSYISVITWGIVALFVLKDIRSMTNKMAEGSPEDVGSDVKKEVL